MVGWDEDPSGYALGSQPCAVFCDNVFNLVSTISAAFLKRGKKPASDLTTQLIDNGRECERIDHTDRVLLGRNAMGTIFVGKIRKFIHDPQYLEPMIC